MRYRLLVSRSNTISYWWELFGKNGLVEQYETRLGRSGQMYEKYTLNPIGVNLHTLENTASSRPQVKEYCQDFFGNA